MTILRWSRTLTATALLNAAVGPHPVGAQTVEGAWSVTWAQAVRYNRDGTSEIQKWGPATLVLHQEGEAVSGHWSPEVTGVTWMVSGTLTNGVLRLTATEHDSDDPELAMVKSMNWQATLIGPPDGERLEGTMWMVIPRMDGEARRRPWHARRAPPP